MLGAIWAALIVGEAGSGDPVFPADIVSGYTGIYSGNRVSLTWTVTEPTMVTRIYHPNSTTLFATKEAGTGYTETGLFVDDNPVFWLVHSNGGEDSETPLILPEV